MADTNYYELLGVARDASEMEIRSAYGRKALASGGGFEPNDPALRVALDTLVDPDKRRAYDATLAVAGPSIPYAEYANAPASATNPYFGYALRGALWFAGGCLFTAISYAGSSGRFTIAWGAVIFGAFQLLRGLASYLRASGPKPAQQLIALAAVVLIGVSAGGWVLASESIGQQDSATLTSWNAAIDSATALTDEADALMKTALSRNGWTPQDRTDFAQVSSLYGRAADEIGKSPILAGHEWYRDGLAKDFREASSVATALSALDATSTQAQWDAQLKRWDTWVKDFNELGTRFDAERLK